MKQRKRSTGFMLASICTFTLLLAGCRGTSSTSNTSQTTSRQISLQQSPTASVTAAPVGTKTYLGQIPNQKAWIGITTDGKNAESFVTDGAQDHPATFAQWFTGSVNNNTIDTTAADKNGDDHLQAMLTDSTASGTVTMAGGQSIAFTANALPAGTATPSATGTAAPPATATPSASMTPSMGLNPGIYKGSSSVNGNAYTAGWLVIPASMASSTATPSATATATPSPTATETPAGTPSATASPSTTTQQAGAVINTKTHDVTTAPALTQDAVSNGSIDVPNVGTFKLTPCQGSTC